MQQVCKDRRRHSAVRSVLAKSIKMSRDEKAHSRNALLSKEAAQRMQAAPKMQTRRGYRANLKVSADAMGIRFDSVEASKAR
ncbi:hypothetical protein CWO91_15715 [Bradyrhizobium genosp. SA-3]|nr:hypothetical protein CWO91_15715 [Bradyrhizobium genosp. SA-3]